jgi:hypothetical protein
VLVALLMVATPASASGLRKCGSDTKARGVSCKKAREVVRGANRKCRNHRAKVCRVRGFACVVRSAAKRGAKLRCTKGKRLVLRRLRHSAGVGSSGPNGLTNCALYGDDDTGQNINHIGAGPTPIDGRGVRFLVGDVSGNFGCVVDFKYEQHSSSPSGKIDGTIRMHIENPLVGSNQYSCSATGSFRCFGPRAGSNLRGSNLRVIYYACIPGQDVKQEGHHIPGYCGTP